MKPAHWVVILLLIIATILWFWLSRVITIEDVKRIGSMALELKASHPVQVLGLFFAAQFATGLFSTPTKGVLTILGGALLGPSLGTLATVVAITCGTTILFFFSRSLLRNKVASKIGQRTAWVEKRLASRPIRAMIGLRLLITLPYGPITLAAALSSVKYRDFMIGTLIGDLPVVALYSFAGEKLFALASTSEALSGTTVGILLVAGAVFFAGAFSGGKRKPLSDGIEQT